MKQHRLLLLFFFYPLLSFSQSDLGRLIDCLDSLTFGSTKSEVSAFLEKNIVASFDKTKIDLSDWQESYNEDMLSIDYFDFDGISYEWAGFFFNKNKLYQISFLWSTAERNCAILSVQSFVDELDKKAVLKKVARPGNKDVRLNTSIEDELTDKPNALKSWLSKDDNLEINIGLQIRMLDNSIPIWAEDGSLDFAQNPDGPDADMVITITSRCKQYAPIDTKFNDYTESDP